MKIFQSTIKFLAFLGITSDGNPLNVKSLLALLSFGIIVGLISSFLFFEADNFKSYTESIYFTSVVLAIFLTYTFVIWKKDNVFWFVNHWERMAVESKLFSFFVRFPR